MAKELNKKEKQNLKLLVEHEKRNLMFYALFYDHLRDKISAKDFERKIDFHLDRLIALLNRLEK